MTSVRNGTTSSVWQSPTRRQSRSRTIPVPCVLTQRDVIRVEGDVTLTCCGVIMTSRQFFVTSRDVEFRSVGVLSSCGKTLVK